MAEALILDTVTTSNTAGEGHDCPIEFTFRVCDFNNFDTNETEVKSFPITPDEPVMPGAMVYSNVSNEIKGGDLVKSMTFLRKLLEKAKANGMYIIAYDLDSFFRIINNTIDRLFVPDNGMVDVSNDTKLDPSKSFSIRSFAKAILPPTKVGTSYAAEAMTMYLAGRDVFKAQRSQFDEGAVTRSVYNQNMNSIILRKLVEMTASSSFKDVVEKVNNASETMFTFGKYSGRLVEDVFKSDYGYCLWCFRKQELMDANPGLQRELARLMMAEKKEKFGGRK